MDCSTQASLSFTVSWGLRKLMSIESVILSNHLILCYPLLLLPSVFPSTRIFPMRWLFASGGQSIRASASVSVLPMNIQDWSPWLFWSPCSPGDSQESSSTPQFKSINSLALRLTYFRVWSSVPFVISSMAWAAYLTVLCLSFPIQRVGERIATPPPVALLWEFMSLWAQKVQSSVWPVAGIEC